jgi:hypothetical protein
MLRKEWTGQKLHIRFQGSNGIICDCTMVLVFICCRHRCTLILSHTSTLKASVKLINWILCVCLALLFMSMGWDYVSELRQTIQVIYEYGATVIWYWGNRRRRRNTSPSATLSTKNNTQTDPGANPGLHGEKPATNRLSHTATRELK